MIGERGNDEHEGIIPLYTADYESPSILKRYTEWQKTTLFYAHHGERNAPELTYLALGLAGESGEFADEVKKIVRETGQFELRPFQEALYSEEHMGKLLKELGDVFYYLNRLGTYFGLTIEQIAMSNTLKLCERHNTVNPFLKEEK